jgi:hypothetical protein
MVDQSKGNIQGSSPVPCQISTTLDDLGRTLEGDWGRWWIAWQPDHHPLGRPWEEDADGSGRVPGTKVSKVGQLGLLGLHMGRRRGLRWRWMRV